jgi:hypothetical protein
MFIFDLTNKPVIHGKQRNWKRQRDRRSKLRVDGDQQRYVDNDHCWSERHWQRHGQLLGCLKHRRLANRNDDHCGADVHC